MSCLDRIDVGDVLIAGSFTLTPGDAAAHRQARAFETMDRPGHTLGSAFVAEPSSLRCPDALLVERGLAAIARRFGVAELRASKARDLRIFAPSVVGERISVVATVRFRSEASTSAFVTLRVELRRRNGTSLGAFEVGVEVPHGARRLAVAA